MQSFTTRLKLIYLPYLIISAGTIVIYTFLHWLLIIKTEWLSLKEIVVNFGLPLGLSLIALLIWLRPRLNYMLLKNKKGKDYKDLYFFTAWISVAVPCIIAQEYLETATGKLTPLNNIEYIGRKPLTKYYTLRQHYIDKKHIAIFNKAEASGKHNESLNLKIFVACPIFASPPRKNTVKALPEKYTISTNKALIIIDGKIADVAAMRNINPQQVQSINVLAPPAATSLYGAKAKNGVIQVTTKSTGNVMPPSIRPNAWLGILYSKQISNNLSDTEKESEFRSFGNESQKAFESTDLETFTYLDRIANSDERDGYMSAVRKLIGDDAAQPIILKAQHEPFAARNGNKLAWLLGSFGAGAAMWLLMLLIPKMSASRVKHANISKQKSGKINLGGIEVFLIPKRRFWATPVLIDLNLFIYILMVIAGLGFINFGAEDLLKWGANYGPQTANGQWWRLLTSTFLHGGIMHILNNMYGLFFGALFLEPLIGSKRIGIAYLICGIAASLTSLWWHPMVISVGASGAIMGIFGINLALISVNRFPAGTNKFLLINCVVFAAFTLLLGLAGGVDNAAHVGGLLCGIVIGYFLHFTSDNWPGQYNDTETTKEPATEIAL